jgi:hypothetical protein
MKQSRTILQTFDYELFLGKKSGSVDKCLIEPTEKIRHLLIKYNITAIFFVDTTYILRLVEEAQNNKVCEKNVTKIENQLQQLKEDGHYIFHHLHPHWLDAIYMAELDEWNLENISKYSFENISQEERNRIFEFSDAFIRKFEGENKVGFRAGGLYIEPIGDFRPFFEKYNIHYEFSVVPDDFSFSKDFSYDFRNFPSEPYNFQENLAKKVETGDFLEFPITMFKLNGLNKIMNSLYYRIIEKKKNNFDGIPASLPIINRTKNSRFSMQLPLSMEFLNPINKHSVLNLIEKNNYIHFLSHPKLITDKNLKSLDFILSKISKNHTIISDFKEIPIFTNR